MRRPLWCVVGVAAMLLVNTPQPQAMTVVPMTFEQLVDEATAVIYARVADVRGQWTSDRQAIDSVITLEALQYFKGDLGPAPTLKLPGGEAGGMRNVIPGAPVLREGELTVLFLKARGPAMLSTLGLGQGIFRVLRSEPRGELQVRPSHLKDSATGRTLRAAAARGTLDVAALAAAVRARGQQ